MPSWTAFFEGLAGAEADIDAVSLFGEEIYVAPYVTGRSLNLRKSLIAPWIPPIPTTTTRFGFNAVYLERP